MRLVDEQRASLKELLTFWDLNEVMEMNERLDIQKDNEYFAAEKARAEAKH